MWFLYLLTYIFIGTIVSTVIAKSSGINTDDDDSIGPMIFIGLIWPVLLPVLAGYKLVSLFYKKK